ncbi:flavin reductase family protein [Lutimaribacter marinistellae]|uniref:Flavin reductase family protein n=1 Tax=Lutimaribacter marinistellae TaxID=1820329 RepID=A0ABV7TFN3_9RHOB
MGREIAPADFTRAMRQQIGHCTVITAGRGEDRSGLVVTSGISLSAEPPQVLFCLNRDASTWPLISKYRCFGWSSLGAEHRGVAERFAGFGGVSGVRRYDGAKWTTAETGAPLLADAPVAFDCEVAEIIDRATHSIIIGKVRAVHVSGQVDALAYWNGAFQPMATHLPAS